MARLRPRNRRLPNSKSTVSKCKFQRELTELDPNIPDPSKGANKEAFKV